MKIRLGILTFMTNKAGADDKKQRVRKIVRQLAKTYPEALCALNHQTPFQLLAATILSAQCTDERVNMVTPELFRRWPTAKDLANAPVSELEEVIRSTGFFRAKASNLIGMARGLVENHQGEIPQSLEELTALPGVGRKTANVLLGTAFGIPSGVVVDTHVKRISNLLGLTTSDNPEQIEKDLAAIVPQSEWINFSHRLIHHGRQICIARRPKCSTCPLLPYCARVGLSPLDVE
jgi:endonuclease-3